MDVRMPDGTIITGVPDNITQSDLLARYNKFATPAEAPKQTGILADAANREAAKEEAFKGVGTTIADLLKMPAASVVGGTLAIPSGAEQGIKGLARKSMEGQPEALMPASVYQPGLDTEEALFGPETDQQKAQRQLNAQRAVAAMPSIPGAKELAKVGRDAQKSIEASISPASKKAIEESQVTGNIFKGEIEFGTNPTVRGYAMQAASVFGSLVPVVVSSIATKSPAVGGGVGGAMAADEAGTNAAEFINKLSDQQLAEQSPFYSNMIAGGASPEEARSLTVKKAAETGAALQGLVAMGGDTFTGKLVTGAFDKLLSKIAGQSALGKTAAGMGLSSLEQGLSETGEGVASDIGTASVVPSKEIGEGSAQNLVMGVLGGVGPGALSNIGKPAEGAERKPVEPDETIKREPYVRETQGDAEALARSKGFLTPEAPSTELLKETETTKPTEKIKAPTSESQDLQDMLAELEAQLEGKPAPVKVEEPAPIKAEEPAVKESLTPEPVAEEPATLTELKSEEPAKVEPKKDFYQRVDEEVAKIDSAEALVTEFARMRDRQSPLTASSQADPIAVRDALINRLVDKDPVQAGQIAADIDANLAQYSEQSNIPVLKLSSFASSIKKRAEAKGGQAAPAATTEAEPVVEEAKKEEAPANRVTSMTKEQYRKDQETIGQSENGALKIDLNSVNDPKKLVSKYGERNVRMLGKLHGITVKDINSVAKKLLAMNDNLNTVKGKTAEDFKGVNVEGLKNLLKQMGLSTYGNRQQLIQKLTTYEGSISGAFNDRLQDAKHKTAIVKAAQNNEPISDEVLKDYPDVALYVRDRDSELYKSSLKKVMFGMTRNVVGMEIPGLAKDLRASLDSIEDPREKQVTADIADAMDDYYNKTFGQKKEPAKKADKEAPLRKAAYAKNPFMTFLARHGLYHVKDQPGSLKTEFSPDKNPMVSGTGPVFKPSGLQVDEMLPLAIQDGYLPKGGTEDQLYALVQKAFAGNKVEPVYSEQGVENTAAKYAERMAMDQEVYEERAAQTDAEWHGMSEQEYMDMMAREVAAVSDEDFAELDQAINELTETPAGNMSVRAAMEALGFTEQEIQDEENRNAPKADEAVAGEPTQGDEAGQAAPALELETQTAEELKAKQDEIDRLTKENERLSKQAEAKAKADAERDEFVLTGSDRPADLAAAQGQKDIFGAMEEEAPVAAKEEPKLSKNYELALDESTKANEEYSKALLDYRAGKINDDQFLVERKKHDLAVAKFDQAFNQEQARPAAKAKPEVASEVVPAAKKPAAPQLTREPVTIEGEFTEVGEEKQRALITTQVEKLSDAQTATLEKFYGFARDTEEFANAVREDVVNFITKGATYVNGKIRAIIRSMANGVLSVAVAFNPQFVSMPYTIAVPQFETRIEQVMQEVPASVQKQMSEDAKRAYATIYPAIKADLKANDKFFIVADKQTANTFVFNPDGTPFMQSKTLFGVGIGDFVKGNNNIVSNRITPAGLFDLGLRDAKRSVDEAATAGEYDFGKVFVLDKSQKGANGFYSTTIMHSVWTKETDAKQRLAALQKPGAEDSRYSFGCINVDKATYGKLVTNNLAQMDGAKIFIVPENGTDVMSFVNGKATYSTDIIRQRAEPVTKEVKTEVQRAAPKAETERTVTAKEEEGPVFNSIESPMITISFVEGEKKRSPSFKRKIAKINRDRLNGKITDEQAINEVDWAVKQSENERLSKEEPEKKRGYLELVNRLSKAAQKGEISTEAFELATWFMRNNELLVEDLGVEILGKGKEGVGGQYLKGSRVMRLIKDAGSDLTVVHEILHHLERMMPVKVQQAIRKAWAKQLVSAQKKAKTPAEQLYFKLLVDGHYGNNDFSFVDVPDGEMSKVFMKAMAELDFRNPDSRSSFDLAEILLQSGMVKIGNYQYFNPSEFWAVNGSEIVNGRFDAVQGGTLARLKNWLKELAQKIKGLFGMKSHASIINALDSLAKSDGKFLTKDMLGEGAYQNIHTNYRGAEMPEPSWSMAAPSFLNDQLQAFQDNMRDMKVVQSQIEKSIGKIEDRFNAYRKEMFNSSREANESIEFLKYGASPLVKEMIKEKVTNAELAEYLHNRFAPERNAEINEKNQSPDVKDQGSGIHTDAAIKYMESLPEEKRVKFEKLARLVDKIVRGTQDLLVSTGQETQDTINAWRKTSPHYVPLNRSEEELDFVIKGSTFGGMSGLQTGGKFSKSALGSTKTVVNILENVMLQRERAIRRAESGRVGEALYGLAITSPNPNFFMAINPDAIKDKEKFIQELEAMGLDADDAENFLAEPRVAKMVNVQEKGQEPKRTVKYVINPVYRRATNVFTVRIQGQDRFVLFNPKDPQAVRLATELKSLDKENLGVFMGGISNITRYLASVNTQYNPAFGLINLTRDVQGALVNLESTPLAGMQKEVFKHVMPAMFGVAAAIRRGRNEEVKMPPRAVAFFGKDVVDAEWGKLWEMFKTVGGKTAYRDLMVKNRLKIDFLNLSATAEKVHAMELEFEKLNQGPWRKRAEYMLDLFSDFNDTLENSVRLSVFKVALDQGLSVDEAAEIAKNITVNFNKKGAKTKELRALYAFFNPAVQGTMRLAQTINSPAGKAIIRTGLAIGVLQSLVLALAGFDDDDPPEFIKNKGFIIPTGKGNYAVWHFPQGLVALPNAGRILTESTLIAMGLLKSNQSIPSKILDMGLMVFDSFNPLGSGGFFQMIAPTVIDPFAALYGNKDSFGRPIYKEDQSTNPQPGWMRTRDTATEISKKLSWLFNYVSSGGMEYTKGKFSPTGDEIDYLAAQAVGGAGREVKKMFGSAESKIKGEEIPSYKVPIVGRFYGETQTPAATSARFYENVTRMAEHESEIKNRIKNGQDVSKYISKYPESSLWEYANQTENAISQINTDKRKMKEMGATDAELKMQDELKTTLMKQFNDSLRASKK